VLEHRSARTFFQPRFSEIGIHITRYKSRAEDVARAMTASYLDRILKGEEAIHLAGSSSDKERTGYQPQDRQDAWPHRAAGAARRPRTR
jgi:hypothetical protein